jgi:methionyl-tRNA synthetase
LVLSDALYVFAETIRIWAWLVLPFLPETADKIFEQLGLDAKKEKNKKFEEAIKWGGLKPGTQIKKRNPLFPRI